MLTTHLSDTAAPRIDRLLREADEARLARAARRRDAARLALPAGVAAALRASLRRPRGSASRSVCCA